MTQQPREIRDPESDPAAFLGAELKRARLAAGFATQEDLALRLNVERSVVQKAETGVRPLSKEVAAAVDLLFPQFDGMFARLSILARKADGPMPRWFTDWLAAEGEAKTLRWWEPLLIPGLCQTAEYARALFRAWQVAGSDEELDEMVSARMGRQGIFDGDDPPKFWAVIDETVLRRCVGEPKIMHDQLIALAEMADRHRVTVHVIPADAGAHIGLTGGFAIAGGMGDDNPGTVYFETPDRGMSSNDPGTVAKVAVTFDTLRSEALPRRASLDLIMKVAEERWT